MDKSWPLIALRNVRKAFPGVVANDDVNLEIHPGEVHVLLGENGAGKSTLIGMLAGIQKPDSGELRVEGRSVSINSPRHALELGIGTVFQHRMLVPCLTVVENLLLGERAWHRPDRAGIADAFTTLCVDLGLQIDLESRLGSLALGEQQQVEIIRALWRGGKVLVLDEPTAMLTPHGAEQLGRIMTTLKARGVGIVFITHRLDEAFDYGDRITVLRRGKVAGNVTPERLQTASRDELSAQIVHLMFGENMAPKNSSAVSRLQTSEQQPLLQVTALSVDGGGEKRLLDEVDLEIHAGEIFGIAGVDGNGQTILAEALAGQIKATGSIHLDGAELNSRSVAQRHRAGVRYVTDDRLGEGSVGSYSVALNLLLKKIGKAPFWKYGIVQQHAVQESARQLIRDFDIRTPSAETPIGKLSGGNIQKTLLARELDGETRLIIYNKPTHGLDLRTIEVTHNRIRENAALGIATLAISTDLEEILALAHRIGVMVRGRLVGIVINGPDAQRQIGNLIAGGKHT